MILRAYMTFKASWKKFKTRSSKPRTHFSFNITIFKIINGYIKYGNHSIDLIFESIEMVNMEMIP